MEDSDTRDHHDENGNRDDMNGNTNGDTNGNAASNQQLSEQEARAARQPTSPISRALWNFSTQWFLWPQGTGIIAISLHQLDYQFRGLGITSVIVWIYTICLLVVYLFIYMLQIFLFPRHVLRMLQTDFVETSCLSSISITITTIIMMWVLVLPRQWGPGWGMAAYVLWWINCAMATVSVIGIPYVYVRVQPPGFKAMTPAVMLPVISALTAAAGGGIICRYGAISAGAQVPVIIVSYLLVGIGLPLAISFSDVFMTRLFDKSFPPIQRIYQDMLLAGPFGQGSFALQILGECAQRGTFATYDHGSFLTADAAKPIAYASELGGLITWGYGTFWWVFAILSIGNTIIAQPGGWRKTQFTMAAWSLVFPWGVYTNAAIKLGRILDSRAWKVWSTALLLLLLAIWIFNQIFTVKGLITGKVVGLDRGWRKNAYKHDIAYDDKEA